MLRDYWHRYPFTATKSPHPNYRTIIQRTVLRECYFLSLVLVVRLISELEKEIGQIGGETET